MFVGCVGLISHKLYRSRAAKGYRFVESKEFRAMKRIHPLLPESETYWHTVGIVITSMSLALGVAMIIAGLVI
jgi:hypothetical protein